MKARELAKRFAYIGAGAGLVLFAIIGLLPGSFLGGVMGLNVAGMLFGLPVSPGILPRLIVGVFMLLGILVSGIVFVMGSTLIAWLLGYAVGAIVEPKGEVATQQAKTK